MVEKRGQDRYIYLIHVANLIVLPVDHEPAEVRLGLDPNYKSAFLSNAMLIPLLVFVLM